MTNHLRGWMMSFDERLSWFLLGVLVGLLISWLKDIRKGEKTIIEKLEEVDEHVQKQQRNRDEGGFMRFPLIADALLLTAVLLTAWAAFATSATNARLEANQKADDAQDLRIREITICNQEFLFNTIKALNERTTYTQDAADANVDLQTGLAEFIDILLFQPPKTTEERYAALVKFDGKLGKYVEVSRKQKGKTDAYPYPTEEELTECLGYEINTTKESQND